MSETLKPVIICFCIMFGITAGTAIRIYLSELLTHPPAGNVAQSYMAIDNYSNGYYKHLCIAT